MDARTRLLERLDRDSARLAVPQPLGSEELFTRIARLWYANRNPQRVELSVADSDTARSYIRWNSQRWLDPLWPAAAPPMYQGKPLVFDQPETRVVGFDDVEQLRILSATCFTPDPKS